MKSFNFDTLQNLPIPEGWIENALSIPEQKEQKPALIPFWRRPRVIAAAASLILVSALSIALFLSMNNAPVPVKPNSKQASTEIVWSTDANGETVATEIVIVPDTADRQNATQASASPSRLSPDRDPDDPTAPTSSAESGRRSPTESGKPSQATEKPVPTDPSAYPAAPTVPPTEQEEPDPSEPAWEPPTAPPPTEAPREPSTDPNWEPPTEEEWATIDHLGTYFNNDRIPQDGKIYCKLVSLNTGKVYGDFGDFDDERLMTCLHIDTTESYYYYDCRDHFKVPSFFNADECIYSIYDSDGNILYQNECILGS